MILFPMQKISNSQLLNRPVTSRRGGPVDEPLKKISERLGATDDQVLLAWAKAKGAVILT